MNIGIPTLFHLRGQKMLIQRIHNNLHPYIMAAQVCNNYFTKHPLKPPTPEALTL